MIDIDNTDRTILRILQKDSKKTAKEIANILNITASPVYERIKRLEKAGIIKKYVAILDNKMINKSITAYCQISMRYHNEAFIDEFEDQIQKLSEVQECYHMSGEVDFILKLNISNLEEYHAFVRYKLSKIKNIGNINSNFVVKEIKHSSEFEV